MQTNSSTDSTSTASTYSPEISVCVIIVSYRTAELVVESLCALEEERVRQNDHGIAIRAIVIDNDSGDTPTIQQAIVDRHWQEWAELITSERNGGFAYGNNLGFRRAYEINPGTDYFFLLNPDARVRPDAIGSLVDFMEQTPGASCAASSLEGEDGQLWPYAFRFITMVNEIVEAFQIGVLDRLLNDRIVMQKMGDRPEQVDWFPGAAMMIRGSVIKQLGGMDEAYFLYYEELDFCLKLKRSGWTHWYVPASRVMHIAGKSTGVTGEHAHAQRRPDYWFESRRRYFLKNFGVGYAVATDALALFAHSMGHIKNKLSGRQNKQSPHFIFDLCRHSTLIGTNRNIGPAIEYFPPQH